MLQGAANLRFFRKEFIPLYLFVVVLFAMGVAFGALMVNALSFEQNQDMTRYLGGFMHTLTTSSDIGGSPSFIQTFIGHMKWFALIWIFGLSVVGLPLLLVLDFIKGVLVGFTVGYLVGEMAWKGMLFALVSVVPQNLVIIPAIVICSVAAIAFSGQLVRKRFLQRNGASSQSLLSFTSVTLLMVCIMFAVSIFESYASPILMKWVLPVLPPLSAFLSST